MRRRDVEQLFQQYFDGRLSSDEFDRLARELSSDPRALNLYLDLVELDVLLEQEMACESVTADELIRAPSRTGRYVVGTIVLAGCLFVAVFLAVRAVINRPAVPVVADAPHAPSETAAPLRDPLEYEAVAVLSDQFGGTAAENEDGSVVELGTEFFPGDELHVPEPGYAEVEFRSGARLLVQGPAVVSIRSANSADLMSGRALGNVPESAHGFYLSLPGGGVRDLGTRFAASAGEYRQSQVTVLDGAVDVLVEHDGDGANSLTLGRGQSVATVPSEGRLQLLSGVPAALDGIIAFDAGIVELQGDVRFASTAPGPIRSSGNPPVDFVNVYRERTGWSTAEEYSLDLVSPTAPVEWDAQLSADVYLLRFDPVKTGGGTTQVQGRITFRRPILGVMTSPECLFDSDSLMAWPDMAEDWDAQPDAVRERRGANEPNDSVSVSDDGHSLRIVLSAGREEIGIDELRVLVDARDGETTPIQ